MMGYPIDGRIRMCENIRIRDYEYYAHYKSVSKTPAGEVEGSQACIRHQRFAAKARCLSYCQDPDAEKAEFSPA